MNQRRIVIGDVHGHYDTLMQLLEAIAPGQDEQVYFLGDLIDRGPKSAQVVQFVMDNNYPCILGNHEEILLFTVGYGQINQQNLEFWLRSGGNTTIESYNQEIPFQHLDWMRNLPLYRDLGDIFLVHGGIDPKIPLEKQTSEQFCWIRKDFHDINKPYFSDKLIIFGHSITFTFYLEKEQKNVPPGKLVKGPGWLGIDTGVYHPYSGWLTGYDCDNKTVYQVNSISKETRILPLEDAIIVYN